MGLGGGIDRMRGRKRDMAMGTVEMDHGRPGAKEISGARHKDISGGY